MKDKKDLGEELCKYCPLDENLRGAYSTPNGVSVGCEGSNCTEAYENYLESVQEEESEGI